MGAAAIADENPDLVLGGAAMKISNQSKKSNAGLTIIEILIVVAIIGVVMSIGATIITGSSVFRRNVDDITNIIGTNLNYTKLLSARDGTEYRLVFAECTDTDDTDPDCIECETAADYDDYVAGDENLNLIVERGDSNTGSTTWCIQNTYSKKLQSPVDLSMTANIAAGPLNISFSPNGLRSDYRNDTSAETVVIIPAADATVDKCGQVSVNPLGSITAVQGRWDGTDCIAILDPQPTPGP